MHPTGGAERHLAQSISSELVIGLCQFAISAGVEQIIGLYEAHMARVYRRIGWSPRPLAFARADVGKLVVGVWDVSHAAIDAMRIRAEMNQEKVARAALTALMQLMAWPTSHRSSSRTGFQFR